MENQLRGGGTDCVYLSGQYTGRAMGVHPGRWRITSSIGQKLERLATRKQLSLCYNSVHRCTLDFEGRRKSKLRTGNTSSVPVLTISEPSAHRLQAPVLSTAPESNAITAIGVDLASPPKVSKNTLCTLDTPRLSVAQNSGSGGICISCFE